MRHAAIARAWLLAEALVFGLAAWVHSGRLLPGHAHVQARIAETVIALVLLASAAASWAWPRRTRALALFGQGFALLGTLVGLLTIALGIGPRTVPDVVFHALLVAVLATGLLKAAACRRA